MPMFRMLQPRIHSHHGLRIGLVLLLIGEAMAQRADVTGWHGVAWGSTKATAGKALQRVAVHDCRPTPERICTGNELSIDRYQDDGVVYEVELLFAPKQGLTKVTMFADDNGPAFLKVLANLTGLYGKPGLRSGYDGEHEITRTEWRWVLAHGSVVLSSEEGEGARVGYTVTYEAPPVRVIP